MLQAKANFAQAEANLSQARANEVTSRKLHDQTWGRLSRQCAADVEPDRLESWYAAKDDAIDGVIIAGHVAQQAEETWIDMRAEKPDPDGHEVPKVAFGTKKCTTTSSESPEGATPGWVRSPSVFQLLKDAATVEKTKEPQIHTEGSVDRGDVNGKPEELPGVGDKAYSGRETGGGVKCADSVLSGGDGSQSRPAGLIKTPAEGGIEAKAGGGWHEKPKHTTDANTTVSGDARALKVKQAKDRIDKLIAVDLDAELIGLASFIDKLIAVESDPDIHELVRFIGQDQAIAYAIDKLKRETPPKASPGKKSRSKNSGVG